jgi:probable rRNA maturation factor
MNDEHRMSSPLILNRQRRIPISVARLRRFARRLSRHLRLDDSDFTLILTNDRAIRHFNLQFRAQNKPTDILSFPSRANTAKSPADLDVTSLGDMIVSVETAKRQASERRHSLERELCVLMIHGVLHLLGYDHEADAGQMRRKELRLQRELL